MSVPPAISKQDGLDADERLRVGHVHPPEWVNPSPAARYDLVVLGGGTAGLVSAMGAAGLGARVALVERHLLGGDCLNTGCIPSKALLRSARAVEDVRRAERLGVDVPVFRVDFTSVMGRLRARRASIAEHDSAARLKSAGVDVFFGEGRFVDPGTIVVDGRRLRFRRAVIATGGRPAVPPVPGLEGVPFLTSETIFDLTECPERLLVLGAGPIGCELAQAFARLGSSVTLLEQAGQVLPREDPAAALIVEQALERDGVRIHVGVHVEQAQTFGGALRLSISRQADGRVERSEVTGGALLVATGRAPNVEHLGLESAGVRWTDQGVVVNDRLESSNRRVFASGDACSAYKFTHAADAMSRVVLQNALFFGRRKARALVIPWVTFTDPELAHVGVTAAEAAASGGRIDTITVNLSSVDRAVVDDDTAGFVRVHHERGRLRGCTIVARHAGEMIGEAVFALTHGGTCADLSSTVHPYPTYAEALRKIGDAYRRQALTSNATRWFKRYFEWTRWA